MHLPAYCLLIISLILSACTTTRHHPVTVINEQLLSFSGKGAGAGVMLSGAMGPVGIALGVAIDVGIAKDIAKSAHDIDIEALLAKALETSPLAAQLAQSIITIERFGFISWPGEGDRAAPQLHLKINTPNKPSLSLRFPEDWKGTAEIKATIASAPLEDIKRTPALIEQLFLHAIEQSMERIPPN